VVNSRAKGCRREREFAHFLTAKGLKAERGAQRSGSPNSPDVKLTEGYETGYPPPPIHFEVKGVEKGLNLEDALQQAEADSGPLQIPTVAHIKRNERWKITLDAEDFLDFFARTYSEFIKANHDQRPPTYTQPLLPLFQKRLHARPPRRKNTAGKKLGAKAKTTQD